MHEFACLWCSVFATLLLLIMSKNSLAFKCEDNTYAFIIGSASDGREVK